MKQNLTALVSCFSRAYHHCMNQGTWIYKDPLAKQILSEEEYNEIANHMKAGISFFYPNFSGSEEEALALIVNHRLAPSVLARSAFNERHLRNESMLGLKQYIVFAAGYDTSGYELCGDVKLFELDRPEIMADKVSRVERAEINHDSVEYIGCDFEKEDWETKLLASSFDRTKKTHCSLLGLSYYLKKEHFIRVIHTVSALIPGGSSIVFDYPNGQETLYEKTSRKLAEGAGEEMKATYTEQEIEKIGEACGLHLYEHIGKGEMDRDYFAAYHLKHPERKMTAPPGICYCLLVKNDTCSTKGICDVNIN